MSADPGPRLAVVLVDDVGPAPTLCGRPALDWLMDTVQALDATVTVVPAVAAAHPAEASAAAGCGATTLVLPCSAPLLQPHTLRRLLASLDAVRSAALSLAGPAPWWAEPAAAAPRIVLATRDAAQPAETTTALGGVEALSLTDPAERAAIENALYQRIAAGWMAAGVVIEDPGTTRIDATVHLEAGARIRSHTELIGHTVIGRDAIIGPVATVRDSVIGAGCLVHYAVCQDVEIGAEGNIGPFAWVRTGSRLGDRCRVGAYVEIADSVVGDGTAVPHLAGLFSADVGHSCNLASMSGSLNYNGGQKRRVRIGDEVSIGSGSILIAPVSIGNRAETAAGSVITEDVPDDALGLSRTPQRNVTGWAAVRRRTGPKSH